MKNVKFLTNKKWEAIDITDKVEGLLEPDAEGFCLVSVPHTTGALLVGENEENLIMDYERTAQTMLASARPFLHCGKDGPNAEGHVFSWLHGFELILPVHEGKFQLGRLQRIFFLDTDGPRERIVFLWMLPFSEK